MGASKNNPNSILKKQGRVSEISTPKRRNTSKRERKKMIAETIMKTDAGKILAMMNGAMNNGK